MEMVHTTKSEQDASRRQRRRHQRAFKEELVRQSLQPGASVSAIALDNGINANMLFKWRREHLRSASPRTSATMKLLRKVMSADAQGAAVVEGSRYKGWEDRLTPDKLVGRRPMVAALEAACVAHSSWSLNPTLAGRLAA